MLPATTPLTRISRPLLICAANSGAVTRAGGLAPNDHVLQHEAGAAGAADAVAEIIRRGPRVGADPHLVEGVIAAAADHRTQNARVLVADHGAQPLHGARIH